MHSLFLNLSQDEARLSQLAMEFRGTHAEQNRLAIAEEYSNIVERLIHSGLWTEIPAPEDQLPDEFMPQAFAEYWSAEGASEQPWAMTIIVMAQIPNGVKHCDTNQVASQITTSAW